MDILLNRLWRLNIVCCAGIAITTVYERTGITSLLFYASFFITAACMWLCLRKKISLYARNTVIVLVLIMVFGFVSIVQGSMSFAYVKKFIIYITALFSYYVVCKIRTTEQTVKMLLGSNLVISVVYILRSRTDGAYLADTLWLYFSNPNFAGMWLYMSLVLLVVSVFFVQKKLYRVVLLALAAYLGYLCFETGARNVWFSIWYAAALSAVCLLTRSNRFRKWMIFAVDLFPLIFAVGYLFLISNDLMSEGIEDVLVSDGKPITSRFIIWQSAFEYVAKRPVFGAYSLVGGGSGSFQLHNTHLDMWAAYGTVGLILFLVYLYRIMKEVNGLCRTKGAMFALAGFMCMSLMGSAEASLYATGMGMYIYVSSFLLLANYMNQKQQNESGISVDRADASPDSPLQ